MNARGSSHKHIIQYLTSHYWSDHVTTGIILLQQELAWFLEVYNQVYLH